MTVTTEDKGPEPQQNENKGSYGKDEQFYTGGPRQIRNSFQRTLFRRSHRSDISILIPICLALCLMITMLGVIFFFTSFFLVTKFYVINIFISDCYCYTIIAVFFLHGVHLIATGATGVVGLGRNPWLLYLHIFLGSFLLLTMCFTYHYELKYEPMVMEQTELSLWCTLSRNRMRYDSSGWDYIQYHLHCCGVSGHTDWCSYRQIHYNENEDMHSTCNEKQLPEASTLGNVNKSDYKSSSQSAVRSPPSKIGFIKITNKSAEHHFNISKVERPDDLLTDNYLLVNCYVPDSCCVVNLTLRTMTELHSENDRCVGGKPYENLYHRGCYGPVVNIMKRFINSFVSIIKCVVILMLFDLPIATYLVLN